MPQTLASLSSELGNPGAAALWTAARRAKLEVSKAQVQAFVKANSTKQILGAPQRAEGKSVSENDNRWMMDLVSFVNVSQVPAGDKPFFLVVVNVRDRYMYARALASKAPADVAAGLRQIMAQAQKEDRKLPDFVSSDNGTEFRNAEVAKALEQKRITQKFKEVGDLNALGLLDRSIGLLKRRLAELHAENKKTWGANLDRAVAALNKTPKPEVLHGAAPAEVHDDPEVQFMLLGDQAKALQQNNRLNKKREEQLGRTDTFRPQEAKLTKFKRNFQVTYGDPRKAHKVEAGRVHTATGESFPLKQVRVVPASARAVKDFGGQGSRRIERGGGAILDALEGLLREEEDGKISLSKAAKVLRGELDDYEGLLRKSGGRLVELIRLAPDRFRLAERPGGRKQAWYFVALA